MIWVIFFIVMLLVTAILTKFKNIKRYWFMGLITIALVFAIDSTLIGLGAYVYSGDLMAINGIPIFYLLSGYPGGILLVYFYPPV